MGRIRLILSLVIGLALVAIGFKWFFQGTYRKTGDIADIYLRYAGIGLMGFAVIAFLVLLVQVYLRSKAGRNQSRP